VTAEDQYSTPAAFRRALTDRLKQAARSSPWTLHQLQRQVAYDRLLERLYLVDGGWIVKGATALLARDLGMRGSLDVDVYRQVAKEVAEADLRRAADLHIGDWFQFQVGTGSQIGISAVNLPVTAIIGATTWTAFRVDLLGTDLRMTAEPDEVPPLVPGVIPYVTQRGYRAYPLPDHIADKVAATYQRHGQAQTPSTRYRDLVDLVSIALGASVAAAATRSAMASEFERRGLPMPQRFDVPERRLWAPGYAAEASRSFLKAGRTIDEALAIVRPFVGPVLSGVAAGEWDRGRRRWI
jgi:hypothetical protein